MKQTEFVFTLKDIDEDGVEILTAFLAVEGFSGFQRVENELFAYISGEVNAGIPDKILRMPVFADSGINYRSREIAKVNWNEKWEKSYKPILIDTICSIVAPFHPEQNTRYSIQIEPKMSFGTGHHQTTRLMIRQLYEMDVKGKRILDMGSGTGVLGIFSLMRGATYVDAIDIDDWATENSRENFEKNALPPESYGILTGDADNIGEKKYDVILANINRNILLQDMKKYTLALNTEGKIVFSGFLKADQKTIHEAAIGIGLQYLSSRSEDEWICSSYEKVY